MTMALDVVAFLERATDAAKAMNFAGLYYLVTASVIAGAPRTIRKGVAYRGGLSPFLGPDDARDLSPSSSRQAMLRSHLIEFLREIEAHEQGSGAKACPLVALRGPQR